MNIDGVWIGNQIYLTLLPTARDYTLQITTINEHHGRSVTAKGREAILCI
jgi:hypothetical protein